MLGLGVDFAMQGITNVTVQNIMVMDFFFSEVGKYPYNFLPPHIQVS